MMRTTPVKFEVGQKYRLTVGKKFEYTVTKLDGNRIYATRADSKMETMHLVADWQLHVVTGILVKI